MYILYSIIFHETDEWNNRIQIQMCKNDHFNP